MPVRMSWSPIVYLLGQRRGGHVLGSADVPGSGMARCTTNLFQMNRTMSAPSVAAMKPAPWSYRYQPIVWPMKVARKAPAIPSRVVRMKPPGLFGPGESTRAMMPAIKPTTMIQMMPDTGASSRFMSTGAVSALEPLVAFAVVAAALFDPLQPTIAVAGLVRIVLIKTRVHAGLAG